MSVLKIYVPWFSISGCRNQTLPY